MKTASRMRAVTTAVGVLLLGASCVCAEDWPQWRGPNRDNKVTGFVAPSTWPKELTQKWKVNVGLGDASPVLVGDKIYVFTRQGGGRGHALPGRGRRPRDLARQVRGDRR